MDSTKRQTVHALAAVAASFVISLAAGASASGAVRSDRAGEAEAAIARTGIAGKLEATLGGAFAGVWFEPSTAQLHVGFTSAPARQLAESIAAQAGLAETVTEIPVASTWAQLQAAQDRWDKRIWGLLERGEAATAVDPARNAVEVELASLVSSLQRTILEYEAGADGVSVLINTSSFPHLRIEPQGKCKKHAEGKAFCEPPIVAGMKFDGKINATEFKSCTAGPAVVKKNSPEPTQIYVLTAGHCVEDAKNAQWFAYNKAEERIEAGLSAGFLNEDADVGVVEIDPSYWAKAKAVIPVPPVIAPWDQKVPEEPDPFPVITEIVPVKGTNSCISAQKIGIGCGEIIKIDQTIVVKKVETKNLVEVKNVGDRAGDSGGPWFSEAPFKGNPPTGYVEGTHVGEKVETKNSVFQPLTVSFKELKERRALDLELLTTANEKRKHLVVKAESEGATTLDGIVSVKCNVSTLEAKIANEGGATGPVESLTFAECGANTVTVVKAGSLTIDPTTSPDGTYTSTGAEITTLTHNILGTIHCIFATNETDIGTFTGSGTTESNATLDIDAAELPRVTTDFACSTTSEWTGSYKVTAPTYLDIA